jgi:hypothetical protein
MNTYIYILPSRHLYLCYSLVYLQKCVYVADSRGSDFIADVITVNKTLKYYVKTINILPY